MHDRNLKCISFLASKFNWIESCFLLQVLFSGNQKRIESNATNRLHGSQDNTYSSHIFFEMYTTNIDSFESNEREQLLTHPPFHRKLCYIFICLLRIARATLASAAPILITKCNEHEQKNHNRAHNIRDESPV